jgi:hypothetical protein
VSLKIPEIRDELKKFGRDPNKYAKLPIKSLDSVVSPGLSSLMFKTVVVSESKKDSYTAYMQFFGIKFSEVKNVNSIVPALINDSLVYHSKPSISNSPVQLYCGCQDFRFRFSKQLYDNKSLIGNWQRYDRVTNDRPEVNPHNLVGYCKHIESFLIALKDSGQITE